MVSYESLITKFSIPQSKLEEECSERVLRLVSSKLTKWKNAAPHLELDEEIVETIQGGPHDEEGKRYELLRRWKQKFAFEATNEKLIRSLLAANRADLATTAAQKISENDVSLESSQSSFSDMPDTCKPFSSSSTAFEEKPSFATRDIPPSSVTTIGSDGHRPIPMRKPQQSSEQSDPSRIVASSIHPEQRSSTRISDLVKTVSGLADVLLREKKEKEEVMGEKKAVLEMLARKKEKIQTLKGRTEQLEKYLRENECKIKQSEQEAHQAKDELGKQQQLLCKAEEDLKSKDDKISKLQGDVFQKEMALKQEKDEKQEKHEQLASAEDQLLQHQEKAARLQQQLQQANSELENEKKAKDVTKKQLDEVSRCIIDLEKGYSKAKGDISSTHNESERLNEVLEWAEKDLAQEQEDVEELKEMMKTKLEDLKEMMRRKNEALAMYRAIIVLVFACIIGVMLQNMGVLS